MGDCDVRRIGGQRFQAGLFIVFESLWYHVSHKRCSKLHLASKPVAAPRLLLTNEIDRVSVTSMAYSAGYFWSGTMTRWISANLLSARWLLISFSSTA